MLGIEWLEENCDSWSFKHGEIRIGRNRYRLDARPSGANKIRPVRGAGKSRNPQCFVNSRRANSVRVEDRFDPGGGTVEKEVRDGRDDVGIPVEESVDDTDSVQPVMGDRQFRKRDQLRRPARYSD